jgi:hypothetical protein
MEDSGAMALDVMPLDQVEAVLARFEQEDSTGKTVGISICWAGTECLLNILANPIDGGRDSWLCSIQLDRRRLNDDFPWTDVSWYLNRIVIPLATSGMAEVASIRWTDAV